jgi:hypothetical protein
MEPEGSLPYLQVPGNSYYTHLQFYMFISIVTFEQYYKLQNKSINQIGMESIKLLACQAKSINTYRNTKTKLLKCCANIYFKHNGMESIKLQIAVSVCVTTVSRNICVLIVAMFVVASHSVCS